MQITFKIDCPDGYRKIELEFEVDFSMSGDIMARGNDPDVLQIDVYDVQANVKTLSGKSITRPVPRWVEDEFFKQWNSLEVYQIKQLFS